MSRSTLITTAGVGGQPGGVPLLDGNSGLLVPSYAEVTQGATPAAPAAGKTRLYVDSNGLLQLLPASGTSRRIAAHWGSGTGFPASPAAGDTFLRTDVGTNGTLYQYVGGAQGVSGWIAEGPIVCTSTTRPAAAAVYLGTQVYETDTGFLWQYAGASTWQPVTPGACSAKVWRTAGMSAALAASTQYDQVPLDGSRMTGGFAYASYQLTVPLDGLYDIDAGSYYSNVTTGNVANAWIARTRASVAVNNVVIQGPVYKPYSQDLQVFFGNKKVPLKAGDKLSMTQYCYVTGVAYYGVAENQGTMVSATWVAPLNGATPL